MAKTLRVMQFVGMLARPSFLCPSYPVVATHAHLLGIMTSRVMWAAEHLAFVVAITSFEIFIRALMIMVIVRLTVFFLRMILISLRLMHFHTSSGIEVKV